MLKAEVGRPSWSEWNAIEPRRALRRWGNALEPRHGATIGR
ncbi:MAG TPA: hypothetical protein VFM51_09025 [Solirubrobacterales bacterium]|nr:hypothetical protein [Solirubrobacterales bacterium]